LDSPITELDRAVLAEAKRRDDAVRLMTHPGIGPVNALAFVLTIGPVARFEHSRKLVSYLGLNPSEESSGGRRRLGAISKQGNTMVRWLLVEAVHHAVRQDFALRQDYQRLKFRRGHAVAKVAIARKLAVRMYWMLRRGADYARLVRMQGSPGATLLNASSSLG
ncbi:MAG: transposase, partial [Candidatus Acidiferrales bacterium]